jgi:hypothetical protein
MKSTVAAYCGGPSFFERQRHAMVSNRPQLMVGKEVKYFDGEPYTEPVYARITFVAVINWAPKAITFAPAAPVAAYCGGF